MSWNPIIDTFPLSPMQHGMLFHHLREPHSGVDIEQLVIHLSEAVDSHRLESAWRWLVKRHDILRARFVWEGVEQPRQEILADVEVPFVVEDARQLSEIGQRKRLQSFLETDRLRGFELDCTPLLRLSLLQWGDTSFSLVWTFHHALLDGRCFPILLREVFEAYAELEKAEISARTEPVPYRRYIDWLQQQRFASADSFWTELLTGFTATTPLVVGRHVPAGEAVYQQGEAWVVMDRETTGGLRKLADEQGLTVNSLVMGAWAILLHRYSGENDVVFAATRACRKSSVAHADETIGLFINTVPVRVRINPEDAALSVFQRVRQQWLDIRPHEHTPLARVKALSQVPPAQPLFETLLVFENYRLDTAMRSLGGAWANRQVELHELTNFPITLAAYDGEAISFKIEFDRRRLDDAAVQRMLGHLRSLLQGAAASPQAAVQDLSLVGEAERRELIDGFNVPAIVPGSRHPLLDGGATLHELFEAQVARQPAAVALTYAGQSLSYRQLNEQANRLARQLVQHGVKPDTLVGLCLDRSNDLVIALMAILKAGGAYLPIDLAYPADRLAFMLEDARAPVLLTESKLTGNLPSTQAKVISVDQVLARLPQPGDEANLPPVAGPDHLAYVIYTSGTTGKPKGTLITHRNVARLFAATEHWYGFNETDVWTLFHSNAFDFSVWEIWGALLYGGRVVVVPFLVSRSPEAFYELLAKEQVTVLNQTPSAFRQLIQAEESIGPKQLALRYVIFGGEALEMQSLRPWFERHGDQEPRLVNMYGITETTVHVTYRPLSKDDLGPSSVIGVPIPDLQIYILDAQRQPVPIGVPGEMYVGGAGLARGYLRRPELTAERFVPDQLTGQPGARLYRTGDLARFLPGRDIEYLGRIDHQVKIRGFRIELGEIESVLCQHPAVREAAVIAREDAPGAKRLVAYLVSPQATPDVSVLREHLKTKLPEYMVPAAFVFLERLPLTASGKVDRKALPVPEHQRPELAGRYVAPRTPAETKLATIWSKVLRLERVGINDNFFELGGDSILSIQIISSARGEGLKLTPRLLFAHQTIAELAAVAGVADDRQTMPEAVAGDVPLTPIQQWFFERNLDAPEHYNQAFLLEVAERMDRSLLERALNELSRQHDALRLRFVREAGGWRQFYSTSEESAPLLWTSIVPLDETELRRSVEEAAVSAQASLNLEKGPLWRVVYFDLGPGRPGRMLVVVHHLAVDGISWRPLLEDLETAYQQLKAGQAVHLPTKTTPYKTWAGRLREFAAAKSLREELPYWKEIPESDGVAEAIEPLAIPEGAAKNTEGTAGTLTVSLTAEETRALLRQVPAAYNTQINDVLLTALVRAWGRWSGSSVLVTQLEGHGRESLFDDMDLSRTVGWFTSIFPVRLALPAAEKSWQPGEALKSVKEQLRQVPQRGIGYGILRYWNADADLSAWPEPPMLFNYLGQFDQVLMGSKLFRFASESTGPWHSPKQRRRHVLEVNSLVMNDRLEVWWRYSPHLQPETAIRQLAEEFLAALKELIEHCQSPHAGGHTPSDFPLARLNQPALDRLLAGRRDVEDIYPLSPIQTLFFSANPGAILSAFDQWHCTLLGDLDVSAFQRAWLETLRRHTILRSTIHGEGLSEPLQMVHRDVRLPWTVEDWRGLPSDQQAERWSSFLKQDRAQPLTLSEAPTMRFALVRLSDKSWKFLWSVPALLLDGWSWPVVFRDASRLYEAFSQELPAQLEPVRPYRDYLEWLGRQSSDEAHTFWQEHLAGFREPTPLPRETPDPDRSGERYGEHAVQISSDATNALQSAARQLQLTFSTLVQGAWALLLNRQSGAADVVFGAAFAGRPADLRGVESIVGPFVNNLPVRVTVNRDATAGTFFRQLHARLLEMSPFQFMPLMEIQGASEVPWRHRLFESLIVFQNYLVDESARRFGGQIEIAGFAGPVHTNYPVLLLAEPGAVLRLTLIYDQESVALATAKRWGRDLATLLERLPSFLEKRLADLQEVMSPSPPAGAQAKRRFRAQLQNFVPPQTEMEQAIAGVWQKMFGVEQVSIEDNFFDLGGHSLLLVQTHSRLLETLRIEFPIVTLFEHPTVRSLASHLGHAAAPVPEHAEQWRDRAQQQKQALAQLRTKRKKERQ
jgi:amino acid adenylation domain-containing protein/non-ribosomal peptide synthase protein (TIGR01720 family)